MNIKAYIFTAIIAICTYLIPAISSATTYTVKARLDSAYILMGKQTTIHIEVVGNLAENGNLTSNDSLWRDVELVGITDPEIKELGNGRKELRRDMIIQAFDSGLYTLPPILYVQGQESVASNELVLKVIPVNVDSLISIHDYADVASAGSHLFDFMPDWMTDYGLWILLALAVIGISIFVYMKWLRKGKLPLIPTRKPIPPYQVAMQALQQLQTQHLCERGEEKEYYTKLTEILRVYLYNRFGINAMEMTSSQIIDSVRTNEDAKTSESLMKEILETADFVKFAKVRPLPDDNTRAFNAAVKFVEDTKPAPEPDSDETKNTADGKQKSNEKNS